MSTPPSVTLTVELPDLSPGAIREEIINRAVERICGNRRRGDTRDDDWTDGVHEEIRKAVVQRIQPAIDAEIRTIVTTTLDKPVRPTNSWGEPTGEPVTLRTTIATRLEFWLSEVVNARGERSTYHGDKTNKRLAWLLDERVEAAFKGGLDKAVAEATAEIRAGVVSRLGREVSATVAGLLGLPKEYATAVQASLAAPLKVPPVVVDIPAAHAPGGDEEVRF
jgi:hypothetical protein